jgi:lipopolysaccharide biosynthesis regulator YciM
MDFEFWWLLPIPAIFFAMGWIAARIDIKHLLRESRALPLSYFRGLNFLLNEQPDKAIESFIEVVKVDPQTIDLHFALGSLFRRQGEIERAIRMHQNLLDRVDLPADKRTMATYELAQDFHRAGLLDRAEELFTKLDGSAFEHSALSHLISIYETEKDWTKAIAAMQRMEVLAKQPYFKEIAQYHCELAQAGAAQVRRRHGQGRAGLAFATYRGCTRATLLLGDLEAQLGRTAEALATWQKIETQNPAFLALAADRFADLYRRQADVSQGIRVLRNYQAQYPSLDLAQRAVHAGARTGRAGCGCRVDQGGTRAQPDTARPGPAARGAAAWSDCGAPSRPRAREGSGRSAHQAARHVQVRPLRLSREAILLALPGMPQVGNLLAAAYRDTRRLCLMQPADSNKHELALTRP